MKRSILRLHSALIFGVLFAIVSYSPVFASNGDEGGDPAYHTSCRCAPEQNVFCQGTLNDTDIFLSADGKLLHGAETSTCRIVWEYEFSAPIEKLAVDTTKQNIYFSSDKTVYALSLSKKELIFSQEMTDQIRNISLQPRDRLSVDLVNGERLYIDLSIFGSAGSDAVRPEQTADPSQNIESKTSVYSSFNGTEEALNDPIKSANSGDDVETEIEIPYDSVAEITFSNNIKATDTVKISSKIETIDTDSDSKVLADEPEKKLYDSNTSQKITHSKPQTIPLVDATEKAARLTGEIVLKPAKRYINKDIYINSNGYTMISMNYLIQSGLCNTCKIGDNIITISGPNGQLITIDNIHKTIRVGDGKPAKFNKYSKPYRTKKLEYYIPLRQVMEQAGYQVNWSQETKSVVISM